MWNYVVEWTGPLVVTFIRDYNIQSELLLSSTSTATCKASYESIYKLSPQYCHSQAMQRSLCNIIYETNELCLVEPELIGA